MDRTFALHGTVVRSSGRQFDRGAVADADVLIVRSVTQVGPALLAGSAVRFVGSTTIGTDHLDLAWLESRQIRWANAPGCNADAAAQYALGMALEASHRLGFELHRRRIGIVGHGNVGSRFARLLRALGAGRIVICDPPQADCGAAGFAGMEEISRCDLVSLHVPLTDTGRWPTRRLVDAGLLDRLPVGTLLLNTARGEVVDGAALSDWLAAGRGHAALDVWPHEPSIPADLVRAATIATPHVAGYSLDGKLRGTEMVYRQFRDWLGAGGGIPDLVAGLPASHLTCAACASPLDAIRTAVPVVRDDDALRRHAARDPTGLATHFDALRKAYPGRRDFAGWHLPAGVPTAVRQVLEALGFH